MANSHDHGNSLPLEPTASIPQQNAATNHSSEEDVLGKLARDNAEKPIERTKTKILLIMIALGLAVFLAALDITIVTTALPTITEYFHSEAAYTWIGSAYLLAVAATTIIWGKFSDIFGRKPILLLANIIFFIGSLIAALSINVGMLVTARAIQ